MIEALAHGSNHNRPTAYEVAVTINGTTLLAGYTARKTKAALIATAMDNNAVRLRMINSLPDNDVSIPAYNRAIGWTMGESIRIHFTGGTEIHPMIG
jgi:hypothetical protein